MRWLGNIHVQAGQAIACALLVVAVVLGSAIIATEAAGVGPPSRLGKERGAGGGDSGETPEPTPIVEEPVDDGDGDGTADTPGDDETTDGSTPTDPTEPEEPVEEATPVPASETVVKSITTITENGARLDWSHTLDLIAFDRKGEDGYYDVWVMRPDGSDEKCLTCDHLDLPNRHMGNPEWHPSGVYIVFQAEKEEHPGGSNLAAPGIGFDSNLWLMTADGSKVWQLTDIPDRRAMLHPQFSADGTQLMWTNGLAIAIADFVVDPEPRLLNERKHNPGGWVLHEVHGFDPNDPSTVIFSGPLEPGQPVWALDVYTYNLTTGELKNLTGSLDQWDEHAHFSPSGGKIAWMSSIDCDCTPGTLGGLKTDLWIMDPDGSNKTRLTRFSDPESPDYTGRKVIVGDMAWNADGTKLMARLLVGPREFIVTVEFTTPQ